MSFSPDWLRAIESHELLLGELLADHPELSSDEQKQLLEADVRRCVGSQIPIDLDHYLMLFPWLAEDHALQRNLVVGEFQRLLGSEPTEELKQRFLARYSRLGRDLEAGIAQRLQQWLQQPIDASLLDWICDQFEEQYLSGNRPTIEQFLGRVPSSTRYELLGQLLSIETYHRQQAKESIDWQDYRQRFPEQAEWIDRLASRQVSTDDSGATVLSFHPGTESAAMRADLSGSFVSRRAVGDFRNGRYRLLHKLGEGSFGSVYLGVDDDLQRRVALKIPRPEALARLSDIDLYLREAQMAASLDHPNIVPVYDVGRAIDGSVYIVSKLVEGLSLGDYLQQRSPSDRSVALILAQVADALHHAHGRKVIHRDIKPANILIDGKTDEPYVTDFGLSIREEDATLGSGLAGSPAYMSPELLRGDGQQLDGRSDLFSLGVVMYQLLTGKLPFEGSTKDLVAREILDTEPPLPHRLRSDVPPTLERICWKLLRKDPAERYQSGEEVSRELQRWANPTRGLQRWAMGALGASLVATCLVMAWIARKEWDRAAKEAVADVTRVPFQQLPLAMERLETMRPAVDPLLQKAIETSDNGSEERLRLTLAMLPSEPELASDVASQLLKLDAKRIGVLLDALQPHSKQIDDSLWKEAEKGDQQTLLQTAAALARFASDSPRWVGIAASVSEALASQDPEVLGEWLPYLDSVNQQLVAHLLPIGLSQPGSGQPDRRVAATKALERYAADDFETLHQIIVEGQPWQFSQCFDEYERFRDLAIERLSAEVAKQAWIPGEALLAEKVDNTPGGFVKDLFQTYGRFYRSGYKQVVDDASDLIHKRMVVNDLMEDDLLPFIRKQAIQAVALMRLAKMQPVNDFLNVDTDPGAISYFVDVAKGRIDRPDDLMQAIEALAAEDSKASQTERRQRHMRLYAFLLALGTFSREDLSPDKRSRWVAILEQMYGSHPSRAVHSATGWLLKHWGEREIVTRIDQTELTYDTSGIREWFVLPLERRFFEGENPAAEGFTEPTEMQATIWLTMIVFPVGFPDPSDSGSEKKEGLTQTIAVSDREITWQQYGAFDQGFRKRIYETNGYGALRSDSAVFGVHWYEAIQSCRWLTEAAGWGEEQQSYEKGLQGHSVASIDLLPLNELIDWPHLPNRAGFRLPTEREWEIVARAGMMTRYNFGRDSNLLNQYGWYEGSGNRDHPVAEKMPSIGGLFDIHGNVHEWTNEVAEKPTDRIHRGGGCDSTATDCGSARRTALGSTKRDEFLGFRVVMNPDALWKSEKPRL
jgi:hypothetical protein